MHDISKENLAIGCKKVSFILHSPTLILILKWIPHTKKKLQASQSEEGIEWKLGVYQCQFFSLVISWLLCKYIFCSLDHLPSPYPLLVLPTTIPLPTSTLPRNISLPQPFPAFSPTLFSLLYSYSCLGQVYLTSVHEALIFTTLATCREPSRNKPRLLYELSVERFTSSKTKVIDFLFEIQKRHAASHWINKAKLHK